MPPKKRGRPRKQPEPPPYQNSEAITGNPDDFEDMTTRPRRRQPRRGQAAVPEVYRDMLSEALPAQSEIPERPLKKRKIAGRGDASSVTHSTAASLMTNDDDDDGDDGDEDLEFEDVVAPGLGADSHPTSLQTAYRDSDEDSEHSDIDWDNFGIDEPDGLFEEEPAGDLNLNLTAKLTPQARKVAPRRKITTADRTLRLEIHKLNVLCLLSHLDRRNEWCNDAVVQKTLERLLSDKILTLLSPKADFTQFRKSESLRLGIEQAAVMWRVKFKITARGMRRALWADNERDVQNYKLPNDSEVISDKSDFQEAAKNLRGSRDLGAQLFCALLRSAGVEARLVCSLQPLSFGTGGPAMPKSQIPRPKTADSSREGTPVDIHGPNSPFIGNSNTPLTVRGRLGHPQAAAYNLPITQAAPVRASTPKKKMNESPFPIYWVEVLDEAIQKWMPVDPLVTESMNKPRLFEPPLSDRQNNMSYVIAFEEAGTARDVTKRYAKAPNAKTRRIRVESTHHGERWWGKVMQAYDRGWKSDLDQIEDVELAACENREPMPKSIQDFKDHPVYALERHLRRNEVLASTQDIGSVAAGKDPDRPGQKKLESVFRRKDVKIARSSDAWYRLGRDVKMGVQPVKTVTARRRPDDDGEEAADTNLYTEDQTELYEAPPIVDGRVPRNSFGNLDIYVPSMIPKGGIHLPYDEASRAARLLGIDYADALTGFEFRGRHGTAVLKGIVVAAEYREAVEAVIEGFRDDLVREEEQRRSLAALKGWKRFLVGLRIKERVDEYREDGEGEDGEGEDGEGEDGEEEDEDEYREDEEEEDEVGMESDAYDEEGGGGFFPE